jgi:predicted nucleic acid-binding protein
MTTRLVLDAWAVLALLQKEEPAATQVRQIIEDAAAGRNELYISIINLGEVYYRVGRAKGQTEAQQTLVDVRRLPLSVVAVDEHTVWAAAEFKMHYTISYADAFAATTADKLGAALVTGDPELEQLAGRIQLERLVRH